MTTAATGSVSRDAHDGEQSSGSSPQPVRAHGPPKRNRRPEAGGFLRFEGWRIRHDRGQPDRADRYR